MRVYVPPAARETNLVFSDFKGQVGIQVARGVGRKLGPRRRYRSVNKGKAYVRKSWYDNGGSARELRQGSRLIIVVIAICAVAERGALHSTRAVVSRKHAASAVGKHTRACDLLLCRLYTNGRVVMLTSAVCFPEVSQGSVWDLSIRPIRRYIFLPGLGYFYLLLPRLGIVNDICK